MDRGDQDLDEIITDRKHRHPISNEEAALLLQDAYSKRQEQF